tara:strand:+ start:388 stop:2598 length:2211 start_codon:yes stop_codon:yes gene_type:complete
MKQISQKMKDGNIKIIETPYPIFYPGSVLVKNYFSLISAGTEGGTISTARKGYLGKAMERPKELKKVIETIAIQGPLRTYNSVMKKLESYSSLGYSCVGEVIDVCKNEYDIKVGDFVACGGSSASHAEVVVVPVNLCVKLPRQFHSFENKQNDFDNYLKNASYNTLGAIAMQGVRQADLQLGETCAIIGMGLLGHLSAILLQRAGVRVIGIDVNMQVIELGEKYCLDLALIRNDPGIVNKILNYTNGIGCDAVIITAASNSLDPINFAGEISRKKGTVVVVGAVPTGFDRNPHYYDKELTVRMSCSYGPGRYDPEYEEKGNDYPVGYVRWTERRNMDAFQNLIASKKIDIEYLTTHSFALKDSSIAYDLILKKNEFHLGIIISYDQLDKKPKSKITTNDINPKSVDLKLHNKSHIHLGFIGAGSYAQGMLLPHIIKYNDVIMDGIMTATSTSSRYVADRFGFKFCTDKIDEILKEDKINTIFIVSQHDSHGRYTIQALEAGKNVFVEKPLCIKEDELNKIKLLSTTKNFPSLMVGYNRRFSPLTKIIKKKMIQGPFSMLYRINAGMIPADSWVQDKDIGGGRIIGELCHFVDYLTYINGSLPISVFATIMDGANNNFDTLVVSIKYQNGSVGSIQYFANGAKLLPKEYVEIYSHGVTAILNDFKELKIFGKGKPYKKKLFRQNKGQKDEISLFLDAVKTGGQYPIPLTEIFNTSELCFKIHESIRTGKNVNLYINL